MKRGDYYMNHDNKGNAAKKIFGAVASAIFLIIGPLIFILVSLFAMYPLMNELPLIFILLYILAPSILIVTGIAVLVSRIKEIKGGEEDEASKY